MKTATAILGPDAECSDLHSKYFIEGLTALRHGVWDADDIRDIIKRYPEKHNYIFTSSHISEARLPRIRGIKYQVILIGLQERDVLKERYNSPRNVRKEIVEMLGSNWVRVRHLDGEETGLYEVIPMDTLCEYYEKLEIDYE